MLIELSQQEKCLLFKQDPASKDKGGFQGLLVNLQSQTDSAGRLFLTNSILAKIQRYAFHYGNGGWENRLMSIFSRTLGQNLSGQNSNSSQRLKIAA
jgi:hypothetical protein